MKTRRNGCIHGRFLMNFGIRLSHISPRNRGIGNRSMYATREEEGSQFLPKRCLKELYTYCAREYNGKLRPKSVLAAQVRSTDIFLNGRLPGYLKNFGKQALPSTMRWKESP